MTPTTLQEIDDAPGPCYRILGSDGDWLIDTYYVEDHPQGARWCFRYEGEFCGEDMTEREARDPHWTPFY